MKDNIQESVGRKYFNRGSDQELLHQSLNSTFLFVSSLLPSHPLTSFANNPPTLLSYISEASTLEMERKR